jgi:hypothetical protein
MHVNPLVMVNEVKQFELWIGYAIFLRCTVEGKSKLFKCDR